MNKPEHWQEKNRKEAMFAFTYQPLVYVMDAYISFWYREERNPVWFLFIVDQTGCGLLWSPVLGCLLWLWQFSSEIRRKHTGRNLFYPVYSLAACLLGEIVVSVITNVWFCGLLGEKRNCLCERVHMHTFIQPPGEAESEECREMPFLDWSLLLTGEFCTLHVWTQHMPYTFTSKKILLHALSITHAHIFPLHHSNGFPGTYIPAHNGIIFIPQAFKGLFLQSWCAAMHQAQSKPVRN